MLYTDRRALQTEAYADPAKLRTRISIYQYQQPRHDLRTYVVGYLRDVTAAVLDLGCGDGGYARALRQAGHAVVAADLSPGMAAASSGPAVVADASNLAFRRSSFGAAIALHMLYHVPDPAVALSELKRVIKPGGTLVVSTNALDDKAELRATHAEAAARVGCPISDQGVVTQFHLDLAESLVCGLFETVERHDIRSEVSVPTAAPVIGFIDSTRSWYGDGPEVMPHVERIVNDTIARDGVFRFGAHSGFLVCR